MDIDAFSHADHDGSPREWVVEVVVNPEDGWVVLPLAHWGETDKPQSEQGDPRRPITRSAIAVYSARSNESIRYEFYEPTLVPTRYRNVVTGDIIVLRDTETVFHTPEAAWFVARRQRADALKALAGGTGR